MRVFLQTTLPCGADQAWDRVQTLSLLKEVCWPLVTLHAARDTPLPKEWRPDATVELRPRLFGIVPIGTRVLHWERIDPTVREMQTREHDPLIRRWDHRIHVEPLDAGLCRYTDEIDIEAGLLTLPVWLFARWFYRHRQRRWQRVAKRLTAESAPRVLSGLAQV